jgi:hypothetical protein
VNFPNGYLLAPPPRLGLLFLCADQRSRESGADPRIKNQKTTQRCEFISCNPYRPSGWREIFGAV